MARDLRALAIKYINEVMDDQRQLGYKGRVPVSARRKAVADAEAALRDLAESTTDPKKAIAA
jgi:hypothetical protein